LTTCSSFPDVSWDFPPNPQNHFGLFRRGVLGGSGVLLRFWKTSVTQRPGAPGLRSTREHSQPGGRRVELDESHTESAGDLRRYVLRVSTSAGLRGMAGICWADPLLAYHVLVRHVYGSALGEPTLPRLSPPNTPKIRR